MKKYLRWPLFIVLTALVVAALVPAFSLLHSGSLSKAHASGAASISLSSATGQPGTAIQASGQGFAASEQVNLYLNQVNGTLLASASADGSGNLPATTITIPNQPAGQYTVVAIQETSTITASIPFSIVPIFTLSQKVVQPGSSVTITGAGFGFDDYIELFLDSVNGNSFADSDADYHGNVSSSITLLSASVLQGTHTVIAKSDGTGDITSFPVTFLPHAFQLVGKAGMSAQLKGAAFTANETVQVYWGTQTGQHEGSATTDATGNLSFSFTTPHGLTPGSYPITIVRSHHKPSLVTTQFKLIPVTMTSTPGILSGQPVKISLTGFLPNEGVTFTWNANGGQQVYSYWVDKNGALQTQFTPPSASIGSYTLTVTGSTSGLQVSNSLNIGPGVSAGHGDPGGTITVTGGGFSGGETVNVYFQKPENGVVSATTDTSGSFTVQLTLPSTYNPATTYYIHAVNTTGSEHAAAKFTFYKLSFVVNGYAYYNQQLIMIGTDFAVGEVVNIIWNYQQAGQYTLTTVRADSSGSFDIIQATPSTPNQSTIVVAAVGTTSKLVSTVSVSNYVTIYANPSTGAKGTKVTVNGGSFGSSETVTLSFQGVTVATVKSDAQGAFTATFKVPAISGAGNATIQATGATSGISATTRFSYPPLITLAPSIVQNGDTITVVGKHFSANTNISLSWPTSPGSGGMFVLTDASGSFTATIRITGVQLGTSWISAQDDLSGLSISAPFIVQ